MTKQFVKFVAMIIIAFSFTSCGYNSMVGLEEGVVGQWANVEDSYQRRADLIPNLVNTVKGASQMEKDILESVTNARARATGVTIDPTNITPDALKKFQAAQDGLSSALSRLMMVSERYPDLKSISGFKDLQSQLEGTENRISVERKRFNDSVRAYNTRIRTFPSVVTASIFGFDKKGYFESDPGTEKVPTVDFSKDEQ